MMRLTHAGRIAMNTPAVASQILREVVENPSRGWVLGLRLVPAPIRSRMLASLPRRSPRSMALVAWSNGQTADAREILASAAAGGGRQARDAVALALAFDDPDTAGTLLSHLPDPDPQIVALTAWAAGDLTQARSAVNGPTALRHRIPRAVTRNRLAGELATLDPSWRATSLDSEPGAGAPPVPNTVLHLVTNSFPQWATGYAVRTHEIATAQAAAGLHPHVVTRLGFPVQQGHFGAPRTSVVDGIPYHRLLNRGLAPWSESSAMDRNAVEAVRLARRLRPAVLHAATKYTNGQIALEVGQKLGLPVAYEVRGFLEQTWISRRGDDGGVGSDRYRLARDLETRCMQRADHVFTLGQGMADEIASRGISRDRITIVPNCADRRYFEPLPDPDPIRAGLGIDPGTVVVGLLTHVVGYEGIDTLIEAVAQLRARGEDITLLVVGDGADLGGLRARAAAAGLGRHALLPGRVPYAEVPRYLAVLDIYCVPRRDTLVTRMVTPLKPLEAMAARRPVVASNLPALAEIVTDGVTGRLFQAGDATHLAAVLSDLAADPAIRSTMAASARDWVAEHRTWDQNVRRYVTAYRSMGADVRPWPTHPEERE